MEVEGTAKRGRRTRRGWAAGIVAVLLAAAISGCGSSENKQANSRKANVATTAPTTTTAAPTATAPPATTAPSIAPPPTESSTDATTETTAPPPECLNSLFDPRCGPFHWEPSPTNQPIHIDSVVVDPPHPIAGQTATVTIQWSDPDADKAFVNVLCDGTGCPPLCNGAPCPVPAYSPRPPCTPDRSAYGPWTLPQPIPGAGTLTASLQVPVAGRFTWKVQIWDYSTAYFNLPPRGCNLSDPYASSTEYSDTIDVLPEFPTVPG